MRITKKKKTISCMRCEQSFTSWKALKKHSKSHLSTLKEMKMLQSGQIPDETKEGRGFKGKNKIIVS
jgi:hypothetical protein